MSGEAEEVKKLLAFKKRLESRIEELKTELKEDEELLEVVDKLLLSKGFKRADLAAKPQPPSLEEAKPVEVQEAFREVVPLTTVSGEHLGEIYIGENQLRVVLDEGKRFNAETPPFNQFLVGRVLEKMREKDLELAEAGKLSPDDVFSYEVIREGAFLREIVIRNFGEERLKDLKSSIRWTFEKMYEKIKE